MRWNFRESFYVPELKYQKNYNDKIRLGQLFVKLFLSQGSSEGIQNGRELNIKSSVKTVKWDLSADYRF